MRGSRTNVDQSFSRFYFDHLCQGLAGTHDVSHKPYQAVIDAIRKFSVHTFE